MVWAAIRNVGGIHRTLIGPHGLCNVLDFRAKFAGGLGELFVTRHQRQTMANGDLCDEPVFRMLSKVGADSARYGRKQPSQGQQWIAPGRLVELVDWIVVHGDVLPASEYSAWAYPPEKDVQ